MKDIEDSVKYINSLIFKVKILEENVRALEKMSNAKYIEDCKISIMDTSTKLYNSLTDKLIVDLEQSKQMATLLLDYNRNLLFKLNKELSSYVISKKI